MAHPIVHIELSAHDLAEAKKFYGDIFGWEMQEFPEMNYVTFSSGKEHIGGGFNPVSEQYTAGTVTFYIQTDDIDATLATIGGHGGKTVLPPMEVTGVGQIALFHDLTGNLVGLIQPAPMPG